MKSNYVIFALGLSTLMSPFIACNKSNSDTEQAILPIRSNAPQIAIPSGTTAPMTPFPQSPLTGCPNDPGYGDTILYPQPTTGQDYIVHPVNNPGPGKYLSWPAGLAIDSLTGAIDLSASETGQKYAIGFVQTGTTDTCISPLILAGASYMDSIYMLSEGAELAAPYYDGNPNLTSVCTSLPNGSPGCSFDVTGSAANHKMVMDNSTGVIDLKKSLNGIFGAHPVNGQSATINIYYQLNDPSNMAMQQIQVAIVYYDTESAMAAGLIGAIKNKHAQETAGQLITPGANPRPPLIVVIRH